MVNDSENFIDEQGFRYLNSLSSTLDLAHIAYWEMSLPSGNITFNETKTKILGYNKKDFTHYNDFTRLLHPEDYPIAMQAMRDLLSGKKETYEVIYRIKASDGSYKYFRDFGKIIFKDDSTTIINGIAIDVTDALTNEKHISELLDEQKIKTELFLEEHSKFQLIAENTSDGIMILENNKAVYISPGYKRILGFSDDHYSDHNAEKMIELIHPDDRERIVATVFGSIAQRAESARYSYRMLHANGSIIWKEDSTNFVYDEQGNFVRAYIVGRDITKQKETETELENLNARLSSIFSNMQSAALLEDANRKILYANQFFCDLFSIPVAPEQLFGMDCANSAEDSKMLFLDPEQFVSRVNNLVSAKTKEVNEELQLADGRFFERDYIPIYSGDKFHGHLWVYRDISERKQALHIVEANRKRFEHIFRLSPNAISISRLDTGVFVDINESFETLLGYSRFELIGKSLKTMNFFENENEHDSITEVLVANSELTQHETRVITKYGKTLEIIASLRIFELSGEQLVLTMITDITEIKNLKNHLVYTNEKLSSILSAMPDMVFVIRDDGTFVDFHSSTIEKLIAPPEQFIGKTVWEILPRNLAQLTLDNINLSKTTANIVTYNYSVDLPEGEHIYEGRMTPMQNNLTLTIIRDITENRKNEFELKKLLTAVEQSSASIVITDKQAKIEYVNKRFEEVTGYSKEFAIGKNPKINRRGEESVTNFNEMWKTITSGNSWQGEFRNKNDKGEYFWEKALIAPVIDNNGEISHYIGIKDDITERKKIEAELQSALIKVKESDKLKSSLLMNMSHEFRTPLNGILGFSEILLEYYSERPQQKDMVERIITSGRRLLTTLDSVLELSNLEASRVESYQEIIDIRSLLVSKKVELVNKANERKLNLIYDIKPGEHLCFANLKYIKLIIDHLVDNAIKYTQVGSVSLILSTVTEGGVDFEQLIVKDTGIGISRDHLNFIFDDFRQVSEGISRKYEGIGLGLSLIKRIISLVNGRTRVNSEQGVGSEFIIEIPTYHVSSISIDDNSGELVIEGLNPSNTSNASIVTRRRPLILYVEDNEMNAEIVQMFLAEQFEVEIAVDGISAIHKTKAKNYRLILMDINLGAGIDGVATVRQIRKNPEYEKTPIIAITGYALNKEKDYFLKNGMTHYLAKPFRKNDLFEVINQALNVEI